MKTRNLIIAAATLGMIASSDAAVSFNVFSLNSNNSPDAPTSWFNVGLVVNGNATATFSVTNLVATGNATKISEIWLGTTGAPNDPNDGFFSFFNSDGVIGGVGSFNYNINYNPNDNQGGVPWGVEVTGDAAQGNNAATLNPGETLNITFSLVNQSTTEQDLIDAFNADPQQLGIAFHVQSIGTGYSEKYQALPKSGPIDDPGPNVPDGGTTVTLLGFSLLGLGAVRRLISSQKKA
jgi:hypothetical protein